jgi:hypothetical protein
LEAIKKVACLIFFDPIFISLVCLLFFNSLPTIKNVLLFLSTQDLKREKKFILNGSLHALTARLY